MKLTASWHLKMDSWPLTLPFCHFPWIQVGLFAEFWGSKKQRTIWDRYRVVFVVEMPAKTRYQMYLEMRIEEVGSGWLGVGAWSCGLESLVWCEVSRVDGVGSWASEKGICKISPLGREGNGRELYLDPPTTSYKSGANHRKYFFSTIL